MTQPLPPEFQPHQPAAPVQALNYDLPPRRGRPGVLSAIGVISIVVASLSGLYSLYAGMQGFGFYMLSMMSAQRTGGPWATATVMQTPGPVSVTVPGAPPAVMTPFGMNEAERKAAAETLTNLRPMGSRRREQLDAILTSAGKQLGVDAVTESGVMPDARSGEKGPDYFVTRRGRLELFDDRAVFFPGDGSETLRVSAMPQKPPPDADAAVEGDATLNGDDPGGATVTTPLPGALTQAEVQSVVQQAQSMAGGKLNAAQMAALQALLAGPGQYVPAGATQGAVVSAVVQPNGQAIVSFSSGGMVIVGPQGNTVMQVPPTGAAIMPNFRISPWAVAAFIGLAVVSLGLAVLLLVAGILVVRDSPKGRRLHLVYAGLKIPASVAGGVAMAVVMQQLMSGAAAAAPGAGAAPMQAVALISAAVPALVGCIYPVALLIALNTKTVREYYASATPERA